MEIHGGKARLAIVKEEETIKIPRFNIGYLKNLLRDQLSVGYRKSEAAIGSEFVWTMAMLRGFIENNIEFYGSNEFPEIVVPVRRQISITMKWMANLMRGNLNPGQVELVEGFIDADDLEEITTALVDSGKKKSFQIEPLCTALESLEGIDMPKAINIQKTVDTKLNITPDDLAKVRSMIVTDVFSSDGGHSLTSVSTYGLDDGIIKFLVRWGKCKSGGIYEIEEGTNTKSLGLFNGIALSEGKVLR